MRRRTATTSGSPRSGRGNGRRRRSGSRRNVADAPPTPPLLLASRSPQRRAILEQLGIPFDVVAPTFEEHDRLDADAVELVREQAHGKALSVASQADGRPVLGVDTIVALGGR